MTENSKLRKWEEIVCLPAAAHLLVARSRGMDTHASEFDSEYLPATLDEYDIGDPLDLPHLEYVDENLIPE